MSLGTTDIPPTLREKSTWTPKHNKIANQKVNIFIVSVDWLLLFFLLDIQFFYFTDFSGKIGSNQKMGMFGFVIV